MKPVLLRRGVIASFARFRAFALLLVAALPAGAESAFVHPGLLQNREDLQRMKAAVAAKQEPLYSGYQVFSRDPASQLTYRMRGPFEEIGRNPSVHSREFDQDANAAYQCALQWCITGNHAYAQKSMSILDGWASTLKRCTGADAVLMAGLGPFKMINAAEILLYTDAGWSRVGVGQCERMFKDVIYPVTKDFALFANGNWDAAAIRMNLAIGVFCDDRDIFERALRYYVSGAGNGSITHYIFGETGQCQESGRDQQHTQLGLGLLGDCCEIAWHQGLNLYGYDNNRLLKGFEYTAKYNLDEAVPFAENLDRTGRNRYRVISRLGRGRFRAIYEQIFNHYVRRMGMAAPYTEAVVERIRPEGPGLPGADHPGFGTLLYARTPADWFKPPTVARPSAPAALVADGSLSAVRLSWVAPVDAVNYTVWRATAEGGPFKAIAKNLDASHFTDSEGEPGRLYYYTITASNPAGESPRAYDTVVCAGLPKPWSHADVGNVNVAGRSSFDGRTFRVEGAGADIGGTNDQFQFAYKSVGGEVGIVARFRPQVSCQFSRFGVMLRGALGADAAQAALLLIPNAGTRGRRAAWHATLVVRPTAGKESTVVDSTTIPTPYVEFGRLMRPYWFKLARAGNRISAAISPDGTNWTRVGGTTVELPHRLFVGLAACSHRANLTTTVKFDHVTVSGNEQAEARP